MKTRKILLATTALCMGAGTAAADVALSGSAEMGVAASKDNSVRFHTDIDVTFTLSGTTDAGVTFGSAIDIDEASDEDGGGLSVTLNASMMEADGSNTVGTGATAVTTTADVEQTHLGLGLGYKIGDVSLGVNVGSMVTESTVDPNTSAASGTDRVMIEETVNGVGFDVAYDLGGGATLKFGVGSSETEHDYTYQVANDVRSGSTAAGHDHSTDTNKWSLGVAFSF